MSNGLNKHILKHTMPKKDSNTYNYLFPQIHPVGMIHYFGFYAAKMLQLLVIFFSFIFLPHKMS